MLTGAEAHKNQNRCEAGSWCGRSRGRRCRRLRGRNRRGRVTGVRENRAKTVRGAVVRAAALPRRDTARLRLLDRLREHFPSNEERLLQNVLDKFAYLKYGLGLVLAYIGAKMLLAEGLLGLVPPTPIPIGISLGIVAGLISASMVVSLLAPPDPTHQEVLDNTDAASLIAQIPADASITTTYTDASAVVKKTKIPRDDDDSAPISVSSVEAASLEELP